ncbi:DUF1697 domain-containing protein [Streptosporangium sp. NPDC050280]|uniref:DUF1697 domain-containing protein n=1 Tax=unclassified Streptosporangium TaxID=2632669 RepID=UPI00343B94E5
MTRYVALLRAVNLGSHKKISMPDLRAVCAELGHTDIQTYLQSGNVVFTADEPEAGKVAARLEGRLADGLGLSTKVILRTAGELRAIVEASPAKADDPTGYSVWFLLDSLSADWLDGFDAGRFAPEEMWTASREIYLSLPNGSGRAKLPVALERRLKTPATMRNWRTVTNLVELAAG